MLVALLPVMLPICEHARGWQHAAGLGAPCPSRHQAFKGTEGRTTQCAVQIVALMRLAGAPDNRAPNFARFAHARKLTAASAVSS